MVSLQSRPLLSAGVLVLWCVACSSEDSPKNTSPDNLITVDTTSSLIGPAGGTITLAGAALIVPPGALWEEVDIGMELVERDIDEVIRLSPIVSLTPAGLSFDIPATLFVDFTPEDRPQMMRAETLDGPYADFSNVTYASTIATASLDGFSAYVIAHRTTRPIGGDFEIDGVKYSAAPVVSGDIEGFGYSLYTMVGGDGATEAGRVWYGRNDCWTFRLDGTGIADARGGRNATRSHFPLVGLSAEPGAAGGATFSSVTRMLGEFVDPDYVRSSDLWDFRWGVRLNDDGSLYENYRGDYEFKFDFVSAEAPWASTSHGWALGVGPEPYGVISEPSEVGATNQHFCRFRHVRSELVDDDGLTCRETVITAGVEMVERSCYADGMLNGPYSVTTPAGVVESGTFKDNQRVGGWAYYDELGTKIATANYDDKGIPTGKFEYYDYSGRPWETVTFSGYLRRSVFGLHYELDGPYTEYSRDVEIPPGTIVGKGTHTRGKKDQWWLAFDRMGRLVKADQYDATRQIPTGAQYCLRPYGEPEICLDLTRSAYTRAIVYNYTCNPDSPYMSSRLLDDDGGTTSEVCHTPLPPYEDPLQGPVQECPLSCSR